jgi:hypothetical protein
VSSATLALGIGGLAAIFSAFDTILIRPPPYADADRLVMIWDDMSINDVTAKHNSTRGMDRVAASQYGISPISRPISQATRHSPATASPNSCRRGK